MWYRRDKDEDAFFGAFSTEPTKTSLAGLKEVQAKAFAAWKACPDKNRAEKARLEAELSAATRAVAAAKRAAAAKEELAARPAWADFVDQVVDEYGNIDCGDE